MEKKKIGIVTFHASHNYGSLLQAYALSYYLQSKGYYVEIINLRTEFQMGLYACPILLKKPYLEHIKTIVRHPVFFYKNVRKWFMMEKFINKTLPITKKRYHSCQEIDKDIPKLGYDILICGGDQIWNPFCEDFEISYLLPFTSSIKVSYAPSMGDAVNLMRTDIQDNFKKYLSEFRLISIRENDGAQYLSSLLMRSVDVVLDPVILLPKERYIKLIGARKKKGHPYVFYYTPYIMKDYRSLDIARKFAKDKGLELISTDVLYGRFDVSCYNDSDPFDFLNLIKNASFVIGRSFHLAIFSLIFHKEFFIINGDKDIRINNLLSIFNLEKRGVNIEKPSFDDIHPIDFSIIDDKIEGLIDKAKNYLAKINDINNYPSI